MRRLAFIVCFVLLFLLSNTVFAETERETYSLSEIIEFALRNNPGLASSAKDVEIDSDGVSLAQAGKMPRIDFSSGASRFRYATPLTPISGAPSSGTGFPQFDNTIYDAGLSFVLPLYRGGRLDHEIEIAEIKKSISEDRLQMNRQDLVYNLTGIYYKILQLERLLTANEEAVRQLGAHNKNVELFLKAGTVPRVELLKTEAELAHARQAVLLISNNLESARELLKALMGVKDMGRSITLTADTYHSDKYPLIGEGLNKAFVQRPDYKAALKKIKVAETRIKYIEGKRLPALNFSGEYIDKSGENINFKENWSIMLRLNLPIFDGGTIKSEADREKKRAEKAQEEERSLRNNIVYEVKNSYMNIENAVARIEVAGKAIEAAKETLRVEQLRYETGAGISADIIDAQTTLLRAETDYCQALFDKEMAIASFKRAIGENMYAEVSR